MHRVSLVLLLALAAVPAAAEDAPAPLRPGAGEGMVKGLCGNCHTLNYIRMNAPFLTEAQWKAEVTKMQRAFGASIEDDEAAEIVAYLAAQYSGKK